MLDKTVSANTAIGAALVDAVKKKLAKAGTGTAFLGTVERAPKLPTAETRITLPAADRFEDLYGECVEIAALGGKKGQRMRVKLASLHIDPSYQYRPETEPGRIRQLEKWLEDRGGFDAVEAGAIHVNRRTKGSMFIIDGGGRVWMALRAGLEFIDAYVYEGLSWDEEKAAFIRKNKDRRSIRAPHLFRVEASSGIEPQASIVRIMDKIGYGLEREGGDGGRALFAPSGLLFAWYLDGTGHILEMTLYDLMHTVKHQKGVDARLLVTVAMLRFCGAGKDQRRLRHILLHDPQQKDADVAINQTFVQARALATPFITSRTVQSRDLNPFLFRLLAARFNYNKSRSESVKAIRLVVADAKNALFRFEDPELEMEWGKKTLYKDVWSWQYII